MWSKDDRCKGRGEKEWEREGVYDAEDLLCLLNT